MDVKISQMANAQTLEGSDFFPAVQGSINVKVTMAQVKSYIGSVAPSVSWSTVSDKPFASVSSADFTVSNDELTINPTIKSKFHEHSNKDTLDKFTVDGNKLMWNGNAVGSDYQLPVATATILGGVKPDGVTITANTDGVISCINDSSIPNWVASTSYTVGALVINEAVMYQCTAEHTSGESFDDTEKANWVALTGAKGDKGDSGTSPTATVAQTELGATITITDDNGITTANISNGTSSMISASQTETGASITVTDSSGSSTVNLTNGTNGTNGKSAYEIAVESGFSGDETAWLNSLKGITTVTSSAVNLTGTLTADGWSDTVPYSQTVTVSGLDSDGFPILDLVVSSDTATGIEESNQWCHITKAVTAENSLTAICYKSKPNIDMNFVIKVV